MNRIELAARNNADLCEAVAQANGCFTERTDRLMICLGTPPPFYPQGVTVKAGVELADLAKVTLGFKDSFCDVNPGTSFRELFSAQWIWMEPRAAEIPRLTWRIVRAEEDLARWAEAWGASESTPSPFATALLQHPDFFFLAGWQRGRLVAGVLFNLTPPVVGISNAFAHGPEELPLWEEIRRLASKQFPGRPLTGYERGPSLIGAMHAGFDAIGPLRVWIATSQ